MSKAVLISMRPVWCELTAIGKKTVEVRKTRPTIDTPFPVYIYCTLNKGKYALHTYINSGFGRKEYGIIGAWRSGKDIVDVNEHLPAYRYNAYLAEGKVIGEFVCDSITKYPYEPYNDGEHYMPFGELENTCLDGIQIYDYLKTRDGYGWHISDLVIYDKPKELSEFSTFCEGDGTEKDKRCKGCPHLYFDTIMTTSILTTVLRSGPSASAATLRARRTRVSSTPSATTRVPSPTATLASAPLMLNCPLPDCVLMPPR